MTPETPNRAAPRNQPCGSHSAPVLVDDLESLSPEANNTRKRALNSLPAPATTAANKPPVVAPASDATTRKRPSPFAPAQLDRLKLQRRQETRRKQREQYFDTLAKEADEMGNLPSFPRKIRNEDDLEKLELKRCFELLHAMGRASDANLTVDSTRASIVGFLQAIFKGWDTSVEVPAIAEVGLVKVNAVAGRICNRPNEHKDISACTQSDTCKTQLGVCAVYNNQSLTLTYYKIEPKDVKQRKNNDEASYQLWLEGSSSAQSGMVPSVETLGTSATAPTASNVPAKKNSQIPSSNVKGPDMSFDNTCPQPASQPPTFTEDERIDPLTCPTARVHKEWRDVLKARLHQELLAKMHEQNKRRAIWIARHMIADWEKGAGIKLEEDWTGDCWGFVRAENIQEMLLVLI